MLQRASVAMLALCAVICVDANAQTYVQTAEAQRSIALSTALGEFLRDGKWREAQELIETLTLQERSEPDVKFVEAFIARQRGLHIRAIELYQQMLDDDATLARVRLELARTFVEVGDGRAAEQNFRLALTGGLPAGIRPQVEAALADIESRRGWRYSVSVAVAPDSNVNTATDARQAQLFGLPFELSDEARRTSGVSAQIAAGIERTFAGFNANNVFVGGHLRVTDNEQTEFDDVATGVVVGVERVRGGSREALSLLGERRWFGDEALSREAGLEFEARFGVRNVVHDTTVSVARLDYDQRDDRDAWVYAADWSRMQYVSPNFFWRSGANIRRVEAEAGPERFWGLRISIGAYRSLPRGFGVWVEPSIERRDFDERSMVYAATRRDVAVSLLVRGIKRDMRIFGYSPYLGAEATSNDSNIALEEYDRTRMEFGFTRTF